MKFVRLGSLVVAALVTGVAIGAAVMRTLALNMAGEISKGAKAEFPPILITQDFLRSNNISNMVDLRAAEPALNIADIMAADWIPAVSF